MRTSQRLLLGPALALGLVLAGCEKEGPAEQAGERLDEAMEQSEQWLREKGHEAGDALEEAGEKLEQSTR